MWSFVSQMVYSFRKIVSDHLGDLKIMNVVTTNPHTICNKKYKLLWQ